MVAIAYAKNGELCRVNRIARAPIKRKSPALRIDVARRPVRQKLIIAALKVRSLRATGKDLNILQKVRCRITSGGIVCIESVITGKVEQQARFVGGLSAANHCNKDDGEEEQRQ